MIVIDTSALIAILNHEPERMAFFEAIAAADRRLVSAVTYQEAGQVLFARRGTNGAAQFLRLRGLRARQGDGRAAIV